MYPDGRGEARLMFGVSVVSVKQNLRPPLKRELTLLFREILRHIVRLW